MAALVHRSFFYMAGVDPVDVCSRITLLPMWRYSISSCQRVNDDYYRIPDVLFVMFLYFTTVTCIAHLIFKKTRAKPKRHYY